jgi:hypothetical protein
MKYLEKYPVSVRSVITPNPDLEVESGVISVDYYYPCDNCRNMSKFKINIGDDSPGVFCCSGECRELLDIRNQAELTPSTGTASGDTNPPETASSDRSTVPALPTPGECP